MVQSVIAAGGAGTRLSSITGASPKVLAPVQGKPFLDHKIQRLAERGASSIHLLLGAAADQVLEWVATVRFPVPITWTIEDRPLGVIGALRHAANELDERFVLTYGDVYPVEDEPLAQVLAVADRTILGVLRGTVDEPPNLTVDGSRVIAYGRSPNAHALDAGMLSLRRTDVLDFVSEGQVCHETQFYPDLISRGLDLRVQHSPTVHIGDPAAYARACRYLVENDLTEQQPTSHQH